MELVVAFTSVLPSTLGASESLDKRTLIERLFFVSVRLDAVSTFSKAESRTTILPDV